MHRHVREAVNNTGYDGMPISLGIVQTLIHSLGHGSTADKPNTSQYSILYNSCLDGLDAAYNGYPAGLYGSITVIQYPAGLDASIMVIQLV